MKICDLTQAYTSTSGGIKTYINEKREYLERMTDWRHMLVIPGENNTVERNGRFDVFQVASPFIPGYKPYRFPLNIERVVQILNEERPDVIELGCAYTFPWAAFRHRNKYPCSIVGFYHADFPSTYVESTISNIFGENPAKTAKKISSRYARHVYNKCDITIAPSESFKRHLVGYGVETASCIPLGVDASFYTPDKRSENVRKALGIGENDLFLLYMGRLDKEKRAEMLVEACLMLPEKLKAKLVMIGDGPLKDKLHFTAHQHPEIILLPYTTDKDHLSSLIASADIYVTAGPYETFGLSVVEAQASGLPVVGVNAGALKERVPSGTGILGNVDDPVDMAANIVTIATTDSREMGRYARDHVVATCSWEVTFSRLFDVYRSLAASPCIA